MLMVNVVLIIEQRQFHTGHFFHIEQLMLEGYLD
jgi:hypothetical protein